MATRSSDQETAGFTCIWRIENFKPGVDIKSPKFTVKMLRNSKWYLTLESGCNKETYIFLCKCSRNGCIDISYRMSLLKIDGSNFTFFKAKDSSFSEKENSWGCILNQEETKRLLQEVYEQNGTFTLIFHMWNEFSVKHKPVQCSITTRLENERHVFKLAIEKFSSLAPGDERNFSVSCIHIGQPQLDMNIHLKVGKEGCFTYKIQKISNAKSPFGVNCSIMATNKGLKTQLARITASFRKEESKSQFPKSLNLNIYTDDKNFDLFDDVLILFCEFLIPEVEVCPKLKTPPQEEISINKDAQANSTEECMFSKMDRLMQFFKEKKFCDVTLRTGNKEFAVHKALLCTSSPVFRGMFEKDITESGGNIVDINDIDSDTISLLLRFLHLEPIVALKWEAARKLLYAADKYQIEELKCKCVCFLTSELTVENVCDTFSLSDTYHDESLRHSAQKFFCENYESILCSKEWKEFLKNKTELARNVLHSFADKL